MIYTGLQRGTPWDSIGPVWISKSREKNFGWSTLDCNVGHLWFSVDVQKPRKEFWMIYTGLQRGTPLVQCGSPNAAKRILDDLHWTATWDIVGHRWTPLDTVGHRWTPFDTVGHRWTPLDTVGHRWTPLDTVGHRWTPLDTVGRRAIPWNACFLALINRKIDTYVKCIVSSFCTTILIHLGTKNCTCDLSVRDRSVVSNCRVTYSLVRIPGTGESTCTGQLFGFVRRPKHTSVLVTARRLLDVRTGSRELSSRRWCLRIRWGFRRGSALRSDWYFGTRAGTCNFTSSVILIDPVGVDPTFQLGPCLRNPVQRSLPGFNLFSWSVLSCRLMCWIHGWITSGSLASSIGAIDRDLCKFRTAKRESSYGQFLGFSLNLGVISCMGVRRVGLLVLSWDRDPVRSGRTANFLSLLDQSGFFSHF